MLLLLFFACPFFFLHTHTNIILHTYTYTRAFYITRCSLLLYFRYLSSFLHTSTFSIPLSFFSLVILILSHFFCFPLSSFLKRLSLNPLYILTSTPSKWLQSQSLPSRIRLMYQEPYAYISIWYLTKCVTSSFISSVHKSLWTLGWSV